MPDQRAALRNISQSLREQAHALEALNLPVDPNIPLGMRLLLDAIDYFDVAAAADPAPRPAA